MIPPVLGRAVCSDCDRAIAYEWLLTNGIGGFACGTVADAHSRRYHGLLIAALAPPTDRVLLVSKLDILAHYLGRNYALFSNEFADGTIAPQGLVYLESFYLDQGLPVWRYAFADALVEKRIVMQPGRNTTLVSLKVLRASASVSFTVTPLCNYRDYHNQTSGGWAMEVDQIHGGFKIIAFAGAQPYGIVCEQAEFIRDPAWYWHFKYRMETERGLADTEDLFRPGFFRLTLAEAEQSTFVISTEFPASVTYESVLRQIRTEEKHWLQNLPSEAPDWIRCLALAARQFIVDRRQDSRDAGRTVIAGYPWFTDWGRDSMIALPGLTLALGHFSVAAEILRTFAEYVSEGMIPNRFPDQGSIPEYNTVDATLWFIQAIGQFSQYSGDSSLAGELYPILVEIIDWHRRGSRFGIRIDPEDGLLTAGQAGMQLTWMDAKAGDWVVTPRIGKCVEINALWYNALIVVADLAERTGHLDQAKDYRNSALKVKSSFQRFWNQNRRCLYDVIDSDEGEVYVDGKRCDARLRPNQLLAISLPHTPLDVWQCRAVVDLCGRELLTSYGLRSLADNEPGYQPHYRGNVVRRDGAYHQGTVWAWLIGPFVDAHYRVFRDAQKALSFLAPFELHLNEACLGQIGEIFDAEPPFTARGCFAQAWSAAEILRIYLKLQCADVVEPK